MKLWRPVCLGKASWAAHGTCCEQELNPRCETISAPRTKLLLTAGRSQDQLRTRPVVHRQAAEAGDAHAMGHLGHMYASGVGVEASNTTALEWFRQAAEKNQASALYGLGYMHLSGMGVPPRRQEGFQVLHAGSRAGEAACA